MMGYTPSSFWENFGKYCKKAPYSFGASVRAGLLNDIHLLTISYFK
jgi:hypothetical protein